MTQSGHSADMPRLVRLREVRGTQEVAEMVEQQQADSLLTPAEVAALFRVNPKTVTRWARAGKITAIRTLGGHRRFRATEIRRCLDQLDFDI
jgi:excisionase family DNA binding protein